MAPVSTSPQPAPVLPVDQALEAVEQYGRKLSPPASEAVSILNSLGRVLAETILADRDFPPFPRSTRDGFAVKSTDVQNAPTKLRVVGQIKAGGSFNGTLNSGEAVEIMTGASAPEGSDAVVMVEYTNRDGAEVEVLRGCVAGENIVPAGSEAKAGREMVAPGVRISFAHVAVAAAVGRTQFSVFKRPRVAILSTGDEIVDAAQTPGRFQIRNSNSYSLAAQVIAAGGEPWQLPIAADDSRALRALMEQGLKADLLLLSGGVSMGKFDLVEQTLGELGGKFFFTGALIQPGKPVVFGEAVARGGARPTPFFGLPGNPVSTMVTFDLFARPVLRGLGGALPVRLPVTKARLAKSIKTKTGLTRFLPARLQGPRFDPEVEVVSWQGSGDLMASAQADCYLVAPPDRDQISAGETVSILLRTCPD